MTKATSAAQISWARIDGLMADAHRQRSEYIASSISSACGALRRPMVRWAAGGAIVSLALVGTARAANVEYGEHYEQKYVAACMKTDSAPACACRMEAIEAATSFGVFAQLVDHYDGEIDQDERHGPSIRSAQARCMNIVR